MNFCTMLLTAVFCILVGFTANKAAFAQIAPEPCDPQYLQSLEARAWLEAQREITQNQNLIFKPDSVFEYTCFDLYMGELVQQAEDGDPRLFSQTPRWGQAYVYGDMSTALTNLIGESLWDYLDVNYNHTQLGGRTGTPGYQPAVDYKANNTRPVRSRSYTCDIMDQVWKAAKCANFIANEAEDGFYTFEEYRDGPDHRFLPERDCSEGRWGQNIQIAYEEGGTPWTEDNVQTYFDRLEQCGNPIPTGIIVRRPKEAPTVFPEFICVAPGCHYVPNAGCASN